MIEASAWKVTDGRAPTPELREARKAAVRAFYAQIKSYYATSMAFNLDRKHVGEIIKSAVHV